MIRKYIYNVVETNNEGQNQFNLKSFLYVRSVKKFQVLFILKRKQHRVVFDNVMRKLKKFNLHFQFVNLQ